MSEDTLPPVLACVENALLPETYKHAVDALARCESLDECKSWSDKAAALSSYAKQADDPELENMARRIRARAVRRCGELLENSTAGAETGAKTLFTTILLHKPAARPRPRPISALASNSWRCVSPKLRSKNSTLMSRTRTRQERLCWR